MADNKALLPAPNIPLMQGTSLHPVWYQFFLKIFNRTGGTGGQIPDPPDLITQIAAESPDSSAVVAALFARVAYLEDLILSQSVAPFKPAMDTIVTDNARFCPVNDTNPPDYFYTPPAGNVPVIQPIFYSEATQEQAGLMSAADKIKLDGL